MPYLALDLDARKLCPLVANACGSTAPEVLWGLTELWQHVWQTEADTVSPVVLAGCVGTHAGLVDALVGFGFLASVEGGFRVRGAERYLRVRQAQRAGGKLGRARSSSKVGTGSTSGSTLKSAQALTPSTEHRAPNTKQEEEAKPTTTKSHTPFVVTPPDTPPEQWAGDDFWRWFQFKRQEAGLLAEQGPPRAVGAWFSTALATLNGNIEALQEAVYRFGESKHWQTRTPALPWAAFVVKWTDFVPRGAAHHAEA